MEPPLPGQPLGRCPPERRADEFRITAPREIVAILKQFQDGNVLLNLNGSNGAMLSTTLWSLDRHAASSASAPTRTRR